MDDLRDMLLTTMIQINKLIKRVKAVEENPAIKGLGEYAELYQLDKDGVRSTFEDIHTLTYGDEEVEGTSENLAKRLKALEGQNKISNHADLKTDDQKILSALMSIELFFNMTSFVDEHEGCSLGDYVHHRDILETDYPLSIEEPREGEPLLEEARKAFEIIKAHLIK